MANRLGLAVVLVGLAAGAIAPAAKAQNVTRMVFTPPVVPDTQTDPVRFEATVTGNLPSVVFDYNGADRPMFDNGTNGDRVAGDGVCYVTHFF